MKSKREIQREQRRRQRLYTRLGLIAGAVILLGLLVYALYTNRDTLAASQAEVGEPVEVMADVGHVEEGTDPGPFNTDPPTSGRHYASEYDAGFYTVGQKQDPYPAGYLVHNLEHGYIITWYNCDLLTEQECTTLTSQIQQVLSQESTKTIAFPWPTLETPVVMTSWGRTLAMDQYDPALALDFIRANRNKAPEPNAP